MNEAATLSTIVGNINGLYANLVSYTVGLILFVGAFVPAVIAFFQRRQLAEEYDALSKKVLAELQYHVAEMRQQLKSDVDKVIADEVEKLKVMHLDFKKQVTQELSAVKASTFHLQAMESREFPASCLESVNHALGLYLTADDEGNARAVIHVAITSLQDAKYLGNWDEIEREANEILKTLKEANTNGRYRHDIQAISEAVRDAKARGEKAQESKAA